MPKKDRDELLKRIAALVPFAKGSVCVSHKPCGNPWKCKKCLSGEMHPSVQYSFRENGKLRTMHVQPRFLKQVQEAVANGREVEKLLVDAGKTVAMAAATTVLGMLPLVVDAFYAAMAVTIMCGLTFATILTMVVIPVNYALVFRIPNPPKR